MRISSAFIALVAVPLLAVGWMLLRSAGDHESTTMWTAYVMAATALTGGTAMLTGATVDTALYWFGSDDEEDTQEHTEEVNL